MDEREEKLKIEAALEAGKNGGNILSNAFRRIVSLVKNGIKFLDNHSGSIVAMATVVLAYYAYSSNYSFDRAQYLQSRPYLYFPFPSPHLGINSSSGAISELDYILENSGNTPAYNLHITVSLLDGSNTIATLPNNTVISLIAPGETRTNIDTFNSSPQFVQHLSNDPESEIEIEVHFYDYEGNQHDHILILEKFRARLPSGEYDYGLSTAQEIEN